jgi:hypothetical protein
MTRSIQPTGGNRAVLKDPRFEGRLRESGGVLQRCSFRIQCPTKIRLLLKFSVECIRISIQPSDFYFSSTIKTAISIAVLTIPCFRSLFVCTNPDVLKLKVKECTARTQL